MKELIEIVKIVNAKRQKRLEGIPEDLQEGGDTMMHNFYEGIKGSRYMSDEDAAYDLYDADPSEKKYQMLKSRLKDKLLETVLLLEKKQPWVSPYEENYYKLKRELEIGRTLVEKKAEKTGVKILDRVLDYSLRYRISEFILEAGKLLMQLAPKYRTKMKYSEYVEIVRREIHIFNAEIVANELYCDLSRKVERTVHPEAFVIRTEKSVKKLETLMMGEDSHMLRIRYFQIQLYLQQIKFDYESVLKICNEIQKYYKENPEMYSHEIFVEFAQAKLDAFRRVGNIDENIKLADDVIEMFPEGSDLWFTVMQNFFVLLIHGKEYKRAEMVITEIMNNVNFKNMDDKVFDKWRLYAGAIYVLTAMGHLRSKRMVSKPFKKKFEILDILDNMPNFEKDRLEFNTSFLVIQFMHYFANNEFRKILDMEGEIAFYLERNTLKLKGHRRTFAFLRMLQTMIQHNFKANMIRKTTLRYYKQLVDNTPDNEILDSLEIIPYVSLWDFMIQELNDQVKVYAAE